ncbi:MAG: hypothetical protein H0T46_04795, partial [Deltaproteobacteria bacterium]|nr:hypothetical protein [Deltaproteobacteria bacterium]
MHAANRHVERWAPETTANQPRSMRALGFVDRMVAPWIETAQRSASLRLFTHYTTTGTSEREGAAVSWVFPRPWYQDELDWMAAARQTQVHVAQQAAPAPTMFTTRGTFVAPQSMPQQRTAISAPEAAMPSALYEYVAPSLSIAQPAAHANIPGVGYGGSAAARADAYTSLVPLAAVQAAELMSRAVAPLVRTTAATETTPATMGRVSPALRQMLTTMLERASVPTTDARVAQQAPELVTPPAPRPDVPFEAAPAAAIATRSPSAQLADQYAEQRVRIAELQRIARVSAEREIAARQAAQTAEAAITTRVDERAAAQRVEETRTAAQQSAVVAQEAARTAQTAHTAQSAAEAERLRVEERVAQRIAERAQES